MPATSLWELPDVSQIRTPALLLKEQAQALVRLTNAVLEGRVTSGVSPDGSLSHRLQVVAPLLNGYTYTVVEIEHGVDPYPLRFLSPATRGFVECRTEAELQERLKLTLTSEPIKNAIGGLLVQSHQTDNGVTTVRANQYS